ncbi:hypothetical protein [uncultured Holdemanella sp.]|uniref:hypothetical protein n=1 Tax=uncultured Holdemanella sp. TaxID=1763549 RepID=UPI0025E1857F|nr:hypothetical protein [uncultured Holdemanella sp.]
MKVCYLVYREDNVMVFDSQVLEYLKKLKTNPNIEHVKLVLFRHQDNLTCKKDVEKKILNYIDDYVTFATLAPPLTMLQLNLDVLRFKKYIKMQYEEDEEIAVICRGDFATYIGAKGFYTFENSRILFDNRGLPIEESLMKNSNSPIYSLNRRIKKKSILYSKSHCDLYNFVTNSMRNYDIQQYGYLDNIPYSIIPTLYSAEKLDEDYLKKIKKRENYLENQYVITYVGSTEAWQLSNKLMDTIRSIFDFDRDVRFFILSNGDFDEVNSLPKELREKITIKKVPHYEMKYYLALTNLGIIIRDDSIVNSVAAPTKIAEYLTAGVKILYSGKIGILNDLDKITKDCELIKIDSSNEWLNYVDEDIKNKNNLKNQNKLIIKYFDMEYRQEETINLLKKAFKNRKVR